MMMFAASAALLAMTARRSQRIAPVKKILSQPGGKRELRAACEDQRVRDDQRNWKKEQTRNGAAGEEMSSCLMGFFESVEAVDGVDFFGEGEDGD